MRRCVRKKEGVMRGCVSEGVYQRVCHERVCHERVCHERMCIGGYVMREWNRPKSG